MHLASFQQSVFLQSLGWAIANSIWQGGILWIFYQVAVTSYNNNASAKFKNNLSTALLFGNFTWFVITFFIKIVNLHSLPAANIQELLGYSGTDSYAGTIGLAKVISAISVTFPYLSITYLLLLSFFAIKLVNAYRNTNFIKNNGLARPGAEWKIFVDKVTNHITLNKNIKIWFSKYVDVPATIGFLKPVILIPLASLNQLTADQMEAIILHEISHIKRNDYIINLFVSLIETILFFNPFVVLLGRIIKKERENCCDDFVLQYQYDRHSYASALLVLEQSREQQFHLALAATSGRQQLLFRIKRIMEAKNNNDGLNYGQKLLALMIGTGIIFSIGWLTPEKKATRPLVEKIVPVKNLKNSQQSSVAETGNNITGLKDKNTEIVISPVKPGSADDSADNLNLSETTLNGQVDSPEVNKDSDNDGADAETSGDNKIVSPRKAPALNKLQSLNISDDCNFSPDSFLSNQQLLNELHLNIDLKELKAEIEKGSRSISSFDWSNISNQVNENLKKIRFPGFKMDIKNDDIRLELSENEIRKINQREYQLQMLKQLDDQRNLRAMVSRQLKDSLRVSLKNYDEEGVYYNEAGNNNYTLPAPPPPASLKRKPPVQVYQAPHLPQPATNYQYSFKTYNTPKPKATQDPVVSLQYKKGVVIINGKKINIPGMKKFQVEKMIRILENNDQNTEEASSND